MSSKLVIKEPIFIEDDGKPIAVILPIEMYEALRAKTGETPQTQAISGVGQPKPEFDLYREETDTSRVYRIPSPRVVRQ